MPKFHDLIQQSFEELNSFLHNEQVTSRLMIEHFTNNPNLNIRILDLFDVLQELEISPPENDESPLTLHEHQRENVREILISYFGPLSH